MTEKQQPFTTPTLVTRENTKDLRVGDVITFPRNKEQGRQRGTISADGDWRIEVTFDNGEKIELARAGMWGEESTAFRPVENHAPSPTRAPSRSVSEPMPPDATPAEATKHAKRKVTGRAPTALTLTIAHELDVGDVLWFASPGGADVRGEVIAATSREIEVKLDSGILVQWWRPLIPHCTVHRFTSELPVAVVIDEGHLCTCLYSDGQEYVYESELHAALAHKVKLATIEAWEKIPRREYPSESAVLECGACPGDYVVLGDGTAEGEILSVLGPDHVLVRWQDDRSETELHIGAGDLVLRSGAAQRSREERASHE